MAIPASEVTLRHCCMYPAYIDLYTIYIYNKFKKQSREIKMLFLVGSSL